MTSEQYIAARGTLVALTNEYAAIMRRPAGSRKELLLDLLRRVKEAKQQYGLKIDEFGLKA